MLLPRVQVEPRLPGCKPSVLPLNEQPFFPEVRPGLEPDLPHSNLQNHEILDLVALPVCVLGHDPVAGPGSHPAVQAYEARLSSGPPASNVKLQIPVTIRARRPHESWLGPAHLHQLLHK